MLSLFLFISLSLAQNSCYSSQNTLAGSAIQPCFPGSGVSACCQLGDICLSDSSCWNQRYNVTYQYGCSNDPTYSSSVCPRKCGASFANAPWVGLIYCANTTQNAWTCTHPPSNDPAIVPNAASSCSNDSIIAFAGPKSLVPILSMPTVAGGTRVYFSQVNPTSYTPVVGYTPTSIASVTASIPSSVEYVSSTSTSGTRTSGSSTATATATSSSDQGQYTSSGGLSTGAKAGIGAGIGGVALAIAAVVIAWMVLRRRKTAAVVPDEKDSQRSSTTYTPLPETKQTGPAELHADGKKAPSELPDVESNYTPSPAYTSWTRPQPGQVVHELPTDNTR